jgi:hypothetical protein
MLSILPIGVLLLAPLAMLVIRLVRPGFAYQWLVALGALLVAWPMLIAAGFFLPESVILLRWQPEDLFSGSPTLVLDYISWPYALAITTLALSVILTAIVRYKFLNWRAWASTLLLAGFGLLAVMAGNLITMLLAWAALDMIELLILLSQVRESRGRERIVAAFSAKAGGILLLVWAGLVSQSTATPLTFEEIPPLANLYLLLSAGLRLGVLPLHVPFLHELPIRRGIGTMLKLTSAAASLVLLARVASSSLPEELITLLLILLGLAGLYSAAMWAGAKDELEGRPFWVLGMGALSAGAAILSSPSASLAWGLALLLPGGLISLASIRQRSLLPLLFLGILGISALPFTPSWEGVRIYTPPVNPLALVFLVIQGLFMAGYIKHTLRTDLPIDTHERWVWVVYPLGLALLPLTHVFIGIMTITGFDDLAYTGWLAGSLAVFLAAGVFYSARRMPRLPQATISMLSYIFSFNWIYRTLWSIYRGLGGAAIRLSAILEGEGGILWAFVLLAILFTILSQSVPGR